MQARAGGPQYWDLWLSGFDVRTLWDARPMRYCFAVIDDDVVVAGSYGFSRAEEGVYERCGPLGRGGETVFGRVREAVGRCQMSRHQGLFILTDPYLESLVDQSIQLIKFFFGYFYSHCFQEAFINGFSYWVYIVWIKLVGQPP
jgi:hypothetical protein